MAVTTYGTVDGDVSDLESARVDTNTSDEGDSVVWQECWKWQQFYLFPFSFTELSTDGEN